MPDNSCMHAKSSCHCLKSITVVECLMLYGHSKTQILNVILYKNYMYLFISQNSNSECHKTYLYDLRKCMRNEFECNAHDLGLNEAIYSHSHYY